MALVDVVVVSYNSRSSLRKCVEPLAGLDDIRVIVVDNASPDDGLAAVSDLDVTSLALGENRGFAGGCNAGWRAGESTFVLLVNPDAQIDAASVRALAQRLEARPEAAAVAPRIENGEGGLDYSQRRFPRLRSTYSQAFFLHRLFPRASWTDELVRDQAAYERPGSPEWVSGACVLLRRTALEEVGGLDEGYFHYCEDIDLCRRLRDRGHDVLFEPEALAVHEGGVSAPRARLLPVLARSRIRYARKHGSRRFAVLQQLGIALGALTHLAAGRGGAERRAGYVRSLRVSLSRLSDLRP